MEQSTWDVQQLFICSNREMENPESMHCHRVFSGNMNGSNGYPLVDDEGRAENGSEDWGDELLVKLDSYLDDINDRLTISRMVSNSVIKGVVNAVEQEAAEKIAAKELEVANLKEFLQFYNVDFDKIDRLKSSTDKNELEENSSAKHLSFEDTCSKHVMMMESLKGLRNVADQQLKKLKNGIHGARTSSIRRINSGSELVGLGGILLEKDSESCVPIDRVLDSLKMTVDNICLQANSMLMLSKSSLCDWYEERDLQSQLEATVMQSLIRSIQEESEQKLWDQSNLLCSRQVVNLTEKLNEISSLRMELEAISKSLFSAEGQLVAHGSHDADHFQRKILSNHVTSSTTLWEGNGKLEASKADMPESFDAAQLKHMSKEDLVNYFNNTITKMKRNHESAVQELTEGYFSLKREYLKERGSSLPHKKDKELDILRKGISDVILKLDDMLIEKEKLPAVTKDADNYSSLKHRLDNLLSENHQLRDSLIDKKKELKCMASQLSDATEKMLQHSSAVANMSKLIGKLNSDLEDAQIEASIQEDVQKHILVQLIGEINNDMEEMDLENLLKQEIYDIIFSAAAPKVEATANCKIVDSDIESSIAQGLCEVVFKQILKDAWKEIKELYGKYLIEKQKHTYFEMKALEKENELTAEAERNEILKQEISILSKSLVEKEKLATDVSAALTEKREQFELACCEIDSLKKEASVQRTLACESSKELILVKGQLGGAVEQIESDKVEICNLYQKLEQALNEIDSLKKEECEQRKLASESSKNLILVKGRLAGAVEQIELDKVEICNLNQKFEQALKESEDANEQRKMVLSLTQEKHDNVQLVEAKEMELKMLQEAVTFNVQGVLKMFADFEFKVLGKIKSNKLRFENSFSELNSLLKKAKLLRRTQLMYKQKLERRSSDLQLAETEVDLLGDEVDALLNLLEKIYITLDHYSSVLQHYPGITDILKLIRRQLSEESSKPA